MPRNLENRKADFFCKVEKTEVCWIWKAYQDKNGYGIFSLKNRNQRAHRLSYMWAKGEIPEDLEVCHTCDNPSCVNPEHLFLGTHKENGQDMSRKGRVRNGTTGKLPCLE
jgi:hypothetical protein